MTDSLIATKLLIPAPPALLVHRPGLLQQLHEALHDGKRLLLLSAPAGYGKTSLLGAWLKQPDHPPIAWLSLDADDNDPGTFLQYLLAAVTNALPTLPMPHIPAFPGQWNEVAIRTVLSPLVNTLAQQTQALMIVLDDYHEVIAPLVHHTMTFLLKYLPAHVQMVIASRTDPPLQLANMRARQQLSEVRMKDLRFDQHEASAFLRERWLLPVPNYLARLIAQYTEGWAVGLQLVALVGRDHVAQQNPALLQKSHTSTTFILDYLAEEVFLHLPAPMQQFLLRTSILERLTPELCQALMADADVDAAQTLGAAVQANLFLTRLGEQDWYRYHHLFGQFLRTRLAHTMPRQEVAALHVRAGNWLVQQGLRHEAIHHFVHAQAWDELLALLLPVPPLEAIFPRIHMWRGWIAALPDSILHAHPDLLLVKLWGEVLVGDIAIAEQVLAQSDMVFPAASQGSMHVLRQHLAVFRGQLDQQSYEGSRALELLSPEQEPLLWAMSAININGVQALYNATHHSLALIERAWQIAATLDEPMLMLLSAGKLGEIAFFRGNIHLAASWLREVQHLATDSYTVGIPFWCRVMSRVAYEQNDLAHAKQIAQQGLELVQLTKRFHNAPTLYVVLARAHEALHDADDTVIDELLAQGLKTAQQHGRAREPMEIQACQLRRWLARGELLRAQRWGAANPLDAVGSPTIADHWKIVAHVYLARAWMCKHGSYHATTSVEQALAAALAATQADHRTGDYVHLLTLQALLLWDLGRGNEAICAFCQALALGEPAGYLRTFLDEGPAILPLLAQLTVEHAAPTLVAQLHKLLQPADPAASSNPGMAADDALSAREHEVLRCIAEGLSVQQVATRLGISVHTARTHIKHVYAKLDAHNRAQAITQAQIRGVL